MTEPRHGDKAICMHCRKPIEFWDGNSGWPSPRGEKWFHTGRSYPEGAAEHPNYCDETEAQPAPGYCNRCGIPHTGDCKREPGR